VGVGTAGHALRLTLLGFRRLPARFYRRLVDLPFPANGLGERRVTGPDQAVAAFRRLVHGEVERSLLGALVLDRWQCLCGVYTTDGGAEEAADWLRDGVLPALPYPGPRAAVLVVSRPGGSTLPRPGEAAALRDAAEQCRANGVVLLDVLIVSGHRWRSLSETDPLSASLPHQVTMTSMP
jgi:hypothetical protein